MNRTAVYSTVYPSCEPYLSAWYASLKDQSDPAFDLWVGADSMTRASVESAIGLELDAAFLDATYSESPAALRRRCLTELCNKYDLVVLIDSDDEAHPDRVSAAKDSAQPWSLSVCALELINRDGETLGRRMEVNEPVDWAATLSASNIVGMSNAAYDSSLLRELLTFPDDCEVVDWYMATRAWLLGATIRWEPRPLVRYRQHEGNVAAVLPPFTVQHVRAATELVRRHYCRIRSQHPLPGSLEQHRLLDNAIARVDAFRLAIQDPRVMSRYVQALNRLPGQCLWWQIVALDRLEDLWTT